MNKDFDGWNKIKKDVHTTYSRKYYREGEVWWCSLGLNIGYEMDGKGIAVTRPVLIIN